MSTHRKNLLGPWLYASVAALLGSFVLAGLALGGVVPIWSGLVALPVMYLTFKVWDKETNESNNTWGAGARAEKKVGEELDRLHEAGFHVFHDVVPAKEESEGNVDHLLIGREGVFVVETKSWQGVISSGKNRKGEPELLRNGRWLRNCNPLAQARWGAAKTSKVIGDSAGRKPYVIPVVCFSRADVRLYGKVGGVEVCEIGALKHVIFQGRGERYTDEQAKKMAEENTGDVGGPGNAAREASPGETPRTLVLRPSEPLPDARLRLPSLARLSRPVRGGLRGALLSLRAAL